MHEMPCACRKHTRLTCGSHRFRYGEYSRPFIVEAGPAKVDTSCLPAGVEAKYNLTPAKLPLQKKLKDSVGSFSAHNALMLEFFKSTIKLPSSITERPKSPRNEIDPPLGATLGGEGGLAGTARLRGAAGPPAAAAATGRAAAATPIGTTNRLLAPPAAQGSARA